MTHSEFEDYDMYSYFYSLVRQIPDARVSTYGSLARALGDIVAARACGYMLSINPDPVGTPCYKVVRAGGEIGKFTHPDGAEEKIRRLAANGTGVSDGYIENFAETTFDGFVSSYPLAAMKREQEAMASEISLDDDFPSEKVAAVDVSYDDNAGYGAMVIRSGDSIEVRRTVLPVKFPYIPGYLSYREFKFIRELARGFDGLLLVDANGYLHPRGIGLASFAGLMLDVPTIGVAKSVLTGKADGRWIYNNGERSAYIMNRRTIVSAGHRISLSSSVGFLMENYGEKYPDLLKMAHNETVKLRNEKKTGAKSLKSGSE